MQCYFATLQHWIAAALFICILFTLASCSSIDTLAFSVFSVIDELFGNRSASFIEATAYVFPVPLVIILDPFLCLTSVIIEGFWRHPALSQRPVLASLVRVKDLAVLTNESLLVLSFGVVCCHTSISIELYTNAQHLFKPHITSCRTSTSSA